MVGYDDDILDTTPEAQLIKEIINKLNLIKITIFYSMKDNVKKWEDKSQTRRKYWQKNTSDKEMLSEIYKNC